MNRTAIFHQHVTTRSFELHVVSPGTGDMDLFWNTAKDIWRYVDYIHIREKQLSLKQRMLWAQTLKRQGVPSNRIIMNGSGQLAQHGLVGGVHWGQAAIRSYDKELGRVDRLRLGVSVHSLEEAKVAEERGADYLFYGHIYASPSKPNCEPRGLASLAEVCSKLSIPVIAIGGIGTENIAAIRTAGAKGAAVISAIWSSNNPELAAASLRQAITDSEKYAEPRR
ncbi:thiamine phosphate synthase [Paenibacillus pabuli]|uniref:thiamine phosphate synthase n=1 Tax=Paenibacillus pabuli TaxID=1472 RepID=UPI0012FA9AC8|nr:thiamine phosphate synthase [Paenibacillus pabuli]MEC0127121.1 thiamine phosphate synthase [Paenibacillus pabuli]